MKKFFKLLAVLILTLCIGCANKLIIPNSNNSTTQVIKPYGLFNKEEKIEGIQYELCWPNIILGSIFFETIIIPFYCFGFQLYNSTTQVIKPYGLFNKEEKIEGIQYELCWPNIILGSIFFETIIIPFYCFGFQLYEPISSK